jgi:hypothetical protein
MPLQNDVGWRAGAGILAMVRVVITEIGWDGSIPAGRLAPAA